MEPTSKCSEAKNEITYFPTNHVADFHVMIIHNVRQVISWEPIGLDENLIVDEIIVELDLARNSILYGGLAGGYLYNMDH